MGWWPLFMPSFKFFLSLRSYRFPIPVVQVRLFNSGDVYPICPRCRRCLNREYMAFCDCCGQKLSWSLLPFAREIKGPSRHSSPGA